MAPPTNDFKAATINRSIRSIKAELAFLADASQISQHDLQSFLAKLPSETPLGAPIPLETSPVASPAANSRSPLNGFGGLSMHHNTNTAPTNQYPHEKQPQPQPFSQQAEAPPAYPAAPPPPQQQYLCQATALYAYNPTDTGDLALQPNDTVNITEYMNAEWWKGVSVRTGLEGIFPRSYVRVQEAKQPQVQGGGYGNMPLEVAQGGSGQGGVGGAMGGKGAEQGKKFGKKLGNAAIFGAGATIGGNIVNSIF